VSHVIRLLNELRKRPGMYIGAPLLSRLAFFLRGYDMGAERVGAAPPDPFLYEFREWIYGRFGLVNRSWEDLIIADAGGDREGFVRFWELFDEFIAEHTGANGEVVSTFPAAGASGKAIAETSQLF
jgi:hypothetical protein